MRRPIAALSALVLLALPLTAEAGPRRDEQGEARKDMAKGNVRPLREIVRRVVPTMPGAQYLGPEYDATAMVYRLKFIRDGRVVHVDVDARTGEVIHPR